MWRSLSLIVWRIFLELQFSWNNIVIANMLPLIFFTAIHESLLTPNLQVCNVHLFDYVLKLRHSLVLLIMTKVNICCLYCPLTILLWNLVWMLGRLVRGLVGRKQDESASVKLLLFWRLWHHRLILLSFH